MFNVLNACLAPSVPMLPLAAPDGIGADTTANVESAEPHYQRNSNAPDNRHVRRIFACHSNAEIA